MTLHECYHINYRLFICPDSEDIHINFETLGEANAKFEEIKQIMNPHDQLFIIKNIWKEYRNAKSKLEYNIVKKFIKFF